MIGQTNRQSKITTLYLYKYIYVGLDMAKRRHTYLRLLSIAGQNIILD